MRIDGVLGRLPSVTSLEKSAQPAETSFGETIKKAVSEVNDLQTQADEIANKLAAGEAVEIHQAMIAMQKAVTALQFTVQVRNKIIEAYQEIMRMQL
jgi:flagellar hook-basal body complex protein FliE